MVIAVLQFELLVPGAASLKDKRRVVRSVKDRLHAEHQVAVAEVGALDKLNIAVMGLAAVGNDGRRLGDVLDQITAKLRTLTEAELGDTVREITSLGIAEGLGEERDADDAELMREMLGLPDSEEPR